MTPDPYRHANPPPLPDGHTVPHVVPHVVRHRAVRLSRYVYRSGLVALLVAIGLVLGTALR